jgi:hypothetical protein
MKKIKYIYYLIFFIFFCNINAQNFENIKFKKFSKAVNIEKYLPSNYNKNGATDYTSFLQKGIDENNNIIMPDFPVMINTKGLKLKSNSKILFQKNSSLILKPNDLQAYKVISLENLQNVEIYYPKIVGDRDRHLSDEGQWGMGISIKGGVNIYIFMPDISKCWGDAIYIANNKKNTPTNITIQNGLLNENRRNGISIISGKNITIKDIVISNTKGHNPQSGIDIEPNNNGNEISDINIINATTFNSGLHGIVVSTGNIVGKLKKNISVNVKNHKDNGSKIGLGICITRNKIFADDNGVTGNVLVSGGNYQNNDVAIKNYKGNKNDVALKLINVNIENRNNEQLKKMIENFTDDFQNNLNSIIK